MVFYVLKYTIMGIFCQILGQRSMSVFLFLLLVQNGLASKVMPDGMDDAGDKTGNPGNETEQRKNGPEHDSCIQQK